MKKIRTYINVIGNSDYNYTVKDLTEEEFALLKSIGWETKSNAAEISIEEIPTTKELVDKFNEFRDNPKYSDWKMSEIIKDFISMECVGKSWEVMEFLTNELNRTL